MKITGFAFLLTALAVHADILSNASPFMRPPGPDFSPESLEPESAMDNPSYAPFSPADSDFGVQQVLGETPDRAPIRATLSLDAFYTDNAPASIPGNEEGSFLYSTVLGVSWQPLIANGWFADVGFNQEFYEFENEDSMDFQNMLPYLGVVKNLVDLDDTLFYARYEYQRLTTDATSNDDYSAHRLRTGLQKSLYATSHQQLAAGISAAFDFDADPGRLKRNEYAIDLCYTYAFTESLSATAMLRNALWKFDENDRKDYNRLAGIELNYRICANAMVYTGIYYSRNSSNQPFGMNDSQSWQAGLGLGINYNF